jgi:glyoxylate reductase
VSAPRVFATCDIGRDALDRVRAAGLDLEVWPDLEPPPHDVLVGKARGAAALITTLRDRLDAAVAEAGAGTLRIVSQIAVGFDNVDVAAFSARRIAVSNTPDVLTEATAEFAFVLLGAVSRKLAPSEALVRGGRWGSWHPWHPFLGHEVTGKTVAVIGAGRIGRSFASKCSGFDMDILLVDQAVDEAWLAGLQRLQQVRHASGLARRRATAAPVPLDEALRRADYVSLHVPLSHGGTFVTHHLIGEAQLRAMKPTAYLVNTARGPVVDEVALARALREGWIAGAALDVFEVEPLPASSPLLAPDLSERLRLYHHFASGTYETRLSVDPDVGMAGRTAWSVIDALGPSPTYRYCLNREALGGLCGL